MSQPTPKLKYAQVYSDIKERIQNGELHYGDRLGNERWLCESYGCGATTLRRAIDELVKEGFVERRSKKGVYVKYSGLGEYDHPFSLSQELNKIGISSASKILFYARKTVAELDDPRITRYFSCKSDDLFIEIHRLRMADSVPLAISHIFIPEKLVPDFDPWQLTNGSILDVYRAKYNLEVAKSIRKVDPVLATKEQAKLLDVPQRTLLLETASLNTSSTGSVIDFTLSWINTEKTPYSFRFNW